VNKVGDVRAVDDNDLDVVAATWRGRCRLIHWWCCCLSEHLSSHSLCSPPSTLSRRV